MHSETIPLAGRFHFNNRNISPILNHKSKWLISIENLEPKAAQITYYEFVTVSSSSYFLHIFQNDPKI